MRAVQLLDMEIRRIAMMQKNSALKSIIFNKNRATIQVGTQQQVQCFDSIDQTADYLRYYCA